MKCYNCGMVLPAPASLKPLPCRACGSPSVLEADDFFTRGAGNLVRETRAAQAEMARLVEKTIHTGGTAIIEAPVGTGKTFAYMLPAMISTADRVVISTAKKSLQDQIGEKDGPFLLKALSRPPESLVLRKGKNAYACRALAPTKYPVDDADRPTTDASKRFWTWLNESKYGELSTFPGAKPQFWDAIDASDCIGSRCRFASRCGYMKMKKDAEAASVVVTNHTYFGLNLALGGRLLGVFDVLIVDEVHQLENAVRSAFTDELTQHAWTSVLQHTNHTGKTLQDRAGYEAAWKKAFKHFEGQNGALPPDPLGQDGKDMITALQSFQAELEGWRREWGFNPRETLASRKAAARANGEGIRNREDMRLASVVAEALEAISDGYVRENVENTLRADEAALRLIGALERIAKPHKNDVLYAETRSYKDRLISKAVISPVDLSGILGPAFYNIPAVILTSGTITVNKSFDEARKDLGVDWAPAAAAPPAPAAGAPAPSPAPAVPVFTGVMAPAMGSERPKAEELYLTSPFDYRSQALLYLPKHLPMPVSGEKWSPDRTMYIRAITAEIHELCEMARGNAFVLFTATSDMEAVYAELQMRSSTSVWLMQQDNAAQTLQQFRETDNAVILGLKSFWEGVDVQGDKLRLVIIPKLPFPSPSDPVTQAKERLLKQELTAKGLNEQAIIGQIFRRLQIPPMIKDLRQGAGRLIRSQTDRGVCAILDPRIWTGSGKRLPHASQNSYQGYGLTAVTSLDFTNRTEDKSLVRRFLDHIHKTELMR